MTHKTRKDDDDMSMMGLDNFYDTLGDLLEKRAECVENCIHRQAEGIKENIQSAILHVEKFPPLQNEERTQEWGTYLAAIILALIYEPNSELPEKMRSQLSHHFLKIPPHIKQSPTSKPQFTPPPSPPCTTNTVSTPEIVDLS
eukprot:CAMPEP_0116018726 /NCGR_PEP_ID=MMETSP0321-20121206/8815_1 /TAXON_ID=163516 /ORGANISM="Leptocylindrus danicus var. danicus, Strain B650" /LENGTH=142 /DNA_ID=CAMNT_0003489165 /DNA_START=102 /DNA_END=526 /DNA_ORIENTATION=-